MEKPIITRKFAEANSLEYSVKWATVQSSKWAYVTQSSHEDFLQTIALNAAKISTFFDLDVETVMRMVESIHADLVRYLLSECEKESRFGKHIYQKKRDDDKPMNKPIISPEFTEANGLEESITWIAVNSHNWACETGASEEDFEEQVLLNNVARISVFFNMEFVEAYDMVQDELSEFQEWLEQKSANQAEEIFLH